MAPCSSGRTFVDLQGVPGDGADTARAWPAEVYARHVQAKGRCDPNHLPWFGHAIGQPAPAGPETVPA
jgi:hypothetical protein